MKRFVAGRLAWTVFAALLLLSAAFFAVALTPDPNKTMVQFGAAMAALDNPAIEDKQAYIEQAAAAYDEARNRDRPLLLRYWDWMSGYATMRWGWSFAYEKPVENVLARAVPLTALYVVPAVLVAWAVSLAGGIYAAIRGGLPDATGRVFTYVGLGVPAVLLAKGLATYDRVGTISYPHFDPSLGLLAGQNLAALAVPGAIVTFSMLMVQWRAVRSESLELVDEAFVKALRAEGVSMRRLGRHLAKNSTAPLVSLFTAEVLTVLLLTIYVVEHFVGIPGLGAVTLEAFFERDVGLILAAIMLPAFVGLLGNLAADLVAGIVDPRVSD